MDNDLTRTSNKELLIELRNDVKHIASDVRDFSKVAVEAKDRSIKNETKIDDIKLFAGAVAAIITFLINGFVWVISKIKGG